MRIKELIDEAAKFDLEFDRFKQRQKIERDAFVSTRIPKADHVLFDDEADAFVRAGGSLAYLVGRREAQLCQERTS